MKKFFTSILFFIFFITLNAQSVLQEQKEFYNKYNFTKESDWDKLQEQLTGTKFKILPKNDNINQRTSACSLNGRRVYGWHPYWNGSTVHNNYQWNLISDLCYFDYTVNPTTGANSNASFAWSTSSAVTAAKANGVKISFCATLFSSHATFLTSTTAKNTFTQNCINLIKARGANGVNIDFEGLASTQKANFTTFMQQFCQKIHDSIPGSEVSMALYAVDWNGVFDIPNLKNHVDLFIIMGYDYYYSGSTIAGPTDPLYSFETGYNYCMSKSISYYLNQGVPQNKLLLGVPYYGRQYRTTGSTLPATSSGSAYSSTVTYKVARSNTSGNYSAANKKFDVNSYTPYYNFLSGGFNYQLFMDDSSSMRERYDIVNQRSLGGIGIWTLGYDDGYTELWNAISDKLTNCYTQPCSDSVFDYGGPNRNYHDKEIATYTIAPTGASYINLNFNQFEFETGYDTLWLYDGPSTASPLIGAYTGTTSPGNINSTSPAITIKYKTDGATNKVGYKAKYTCQTSDVIAPTTSVTTPTWTTTNFTANFTDGDVGTGIAQRFYSADEYSTAAYWRSNKANGFLNDAFDGTTLHADWIKNAGTWTNSSNTAYNTDQVNSNTNLYTSLTQNANQILYHWTQKIGGTGTNRRAGLHFMASAATGNGRGNSYMVYARVDGGGKLQIYEYIADVMYLNADITYPFVANTNYDFKVIYNKTTGKISVFVNNVLAGSWTDATPLTTGNYICFRSGECTMNIDNVEVLKSRTATTAAISVGSASTNDLRLLNPNATTPAGRIKSYVIDNANNISLQAIKTINIDYTTPSTVGTVRDGLTTTDIATTTSKTQLSANWNSSTDVHSGISKYWYAVGTSAGGTNTVAWTNNGTATSVTKTGLTLTVGTTYYFTVKAENGATLQSTVINSNGQKVVAAFVNTTPTTNAIKSENTVALATLKSFNAYPNPATDILNLEYTLNKATAVNLSVIDITGKEVARILSNEQQTEGTYQYQYTIDKTLAKGIYHVLLNYDKEVKVFKVVIQ